MDAFRELLDGWLTRTETSQAELSRRSSVPQTVISRWLGRSPTRPTPANLSKIAPVIGAAYEDLLRMCGYLPAADATTVALDPAHAELDARLTRLGTTLGQYPRAFWLAVVEASERMAEAGEALPPVSASKKVGINDRGRQQTRRKRPPNGGLTTHFPTLHFATAAY